MGWFQRLFGAKNEKDDVLEQLAEMSGSIETLLGAVEANERGLQKGLRRLSMAQMQQGEAIEAALQQQGGLSFSVEQLLEVLDDLDAVCLAADNISTAREVIVPICRKRQQSLLAQANWQPVANLGEPYPSRHCEVVAAVERDGTPPGTVVEVVQQGYLLSEDNPIRAAKVIVSREPSAPSDTSTRLEKDKHHAKQH